MTTVNQSPLPEFVSGPALPGGLEFIDATPGHPIEIDTSCIHWVRSRQALEELAQELGRVKSFGFDVETGATESDKRLDAKLALVQIYIDEDSAPAEHPLLGKPVIVDVRALRFEAEEHYLEQGAVINYLEPLRRVLEDPEIEKVIHYSDFERSMMARYQIDLHGVFDTCTEARTLRPDLLSHTLQVCLIEICGIEVSKDEQASDWLGTLSDEQILYAARDPLANVILRRALREMSHLLTIPQEWGVLDLLADMGKTYRAYQDLVSPIAPLVGQCDFTIKKAAADIHGRLVSFIKARGAPGYREDGEFGETVLIKESAESTPLIRRRSSHKIDLEKLRTLYPLRFKNLVHEWVSIRDVENLIRESPERHPISFVEEVLGETIEVEDKAGAIRVEPRYEASGIPLFYDLMDELVHYFGEKTPLGAELFVRIRSIAEDLRPDVRESSFAGLAHAVLGVEMLPAKASPQNVTCNIQALTHALLEQEAVRERLSEATSPSFTVSELEAYIAEVKRSQVMCQRRSGIMNEAGPLYARHELLRLRIEEIVTEELAGRGQVTIGDPDIGRVSAEREEVRTIDIEKMRELFPEIYAELRHHRVYIRDLEKCFDGDGFNEDEKRAMIDELLSLSHYSKNWSFSWKIPFRKMVYGTSSSRIPEHDPVLSSEP